MYFVNIAIVERNWLFGERFASAKIKINLKLDRRKYTSTCKKISADLLKENWADCMMELRGADNFKLNELEQDKLNTVIIEEY